MPAKYSHVKKRATNTPPKKISQNSSNHNHNDSKKGSAIAQLRAANPHIDRSLNKTQSELAELEQAVSRILLIRYDHDIARLYSTRLYKVALLQLPTFVMRCVSLGGPGWPGYNCESEEIKDFFRSVISMELRQAGERVATKSVLWSYTAIRHFALSNNITVCEHRGVHSIRLLPHLSSIKAHLEELEALPEPTFNKPPHLGTLQDGYDALEEACEQRHNSNGTDSEGTKEEWGEDWREKVRIGYEKMTQMLWRVAREFDVRGYGLVLRDKLSDKWCDCGCSTDHLGEVCEKTVREDEEKNGVRLGKQKEWDGRGSGVTAWSTAEEEDIWDHDMDFGGLDTPFTDGKLDSPLTVSQMVKLRYVKAEREKEAGNTNFRLGDFHNAIKHYEEAHKIEPELPIYQLNLAAAHLKLSNWMEAEKACTSALGQHKSPKGYYRRAKARRMMGRTEEAIRDLRAILKLQPSNIDAREELLHIYASSMPKSSSPSASEHSTNLPGNNILPKIKPPKPLPYPRIPSDDRKLKIVILPTNFASWGFNVASKTGGPGEKGEKDKKNKVGNGKMTIELRRVDTGLSGLESVLYPNWDKYAVKKV